THQVDVGCEILENLNTADPRLFRRTDGQTAARLIDVDGRVALQGMTADSWNREVHQRLVCMLWKKATKHTDVTNTDVGCSQDIMSRIRGNADLKLPIIDGIVRTPIFDHVGNLRVARGYAPDLRQYVD